MTSNELREKFLKFFERNSHVIIPSASLVPSDEEQLGGKEKVLFTSAGMQPLIPYLMGKPHPQGKRLANVQKCVRTDDIEEVGDAIHHTFFEMLGNWSLGDYWKDEAIELSFKFLTEELSIPVGKLAVSVFVGDDDTPRDEQSASKWKSLGISEKRIAYLGKEANWWPTNPSSFGPCGPDTEMFYWIGSDPAAKTFDPEDKNWVEFWNDVFMEFNRQEDGTLEELPQKNVDTGMGLERMLAILNGKDSDYETDLFESLFKSIDLENSSNMGDRIFIDHMKTAVMLISDGVEPSNKERGYVLRRLIRRAMVKVGSSYLSETVAHMPKATIDLLVKAAIRIYSKQYPEVEKNKDKILKILNEEVSRFSDTLENGLNRFEKVGPHVTAKIAFDLYQSFGFPIELTTELVRDRGWSIDLDGIEEEFKKHQQVSRSTDIGEYKGGLAGHSETEIKYHTATHLLHQALRDVLGPEVFQKGSNITPERLRFDFSYDKKMTDEEVKQAEDLVNKRIQEDLPVDHKIVSLEKAKKLNAIGLFDEKYAEDISIYGVGPGYKLDPEAKDQRDRDGYYSLEFCGGPHVEHTGVIGGIKIEKQEAVSAGVRRIRATII